MLRTEFVDTKKKRANGENLENKRVTTNPFIQLLDRLDESSCSGEGVATVHGEEDTLSGYAAKLGVSSLVARAAGTVQLLHGAIVHG